MTSIDQEDSAGSEISALRQKAESLERRLQEVEADAATRIRLTELKAEALRAGILDIDGLKLLGPDATSGDAGHADDASQIIARLKSEKPWLFGPANSASTSVAPKAAPIKRKHATDMSFDEWRAARAELLRRR